MKLSINHNDLQKGLDIVGAAVAGKTTLPILTGVYLEVSDGVLRLSASDLQKDITTILKCQGEDGAIVLPYNLLSGLVAGLSAPIDLEVNSKTLIAKWKSGNQKGSIKGLHPDDFPSVRWGEQDADLDFEGEELGEILGRVAVSAGVGGEGREWLQSVNISKQPEALLFQGANGFRASFNYIHGENYPDVNVTIPQTSIGRVMALANKSQQVKISFTGKDVLFGFDDVVWLGTSTFEVDYPSLSNIIPKNFVTKVTIEKSNLIAQIRTALLYTKDRGYLVAISVGDDGLTVKAESAELGNYTARCDIIKFKGNKVDFMVSGRYLIDGLEAAPGDEVCLGLVDATQAITVFPADGEDEFVYTVMPMGVG